MQLHAALGNHKLAFASVIKKTIQQKVKKFQKRKCKPKTRYTRWGIGFMTVL